MAKKFFLSQPPSSHTRHVLYFYLCALSYTHADTHTRMRAHLCTTIHSPLFSHPCCPGRAGGGDGAPFQHLLYGPATFGLLPRTHLTPATLSFSCPKQIASALGQHWRFGVAWEVGPGPGAGVCRPGPTWLRQFLLRVTWDGVGVD